MAFRTMEEVVAWAAVHGGEQGVSEALADGRFGADVATIHLCKEWLAATRRAKEQQLTEDSLRAAIRSADAAERSANAAVQSAKATWWAGAAAFVSALAAVITTVVAIWPKK